MTTTKPNLSDIAKREMDKVFVLRLRNERLARELQSRPLRLRDLLKTKSKPQSASKSKPQQVVQ